MKNRLKMIAASVTAGAAAAARRAYAALPSQMTVSMVVGIGCFGWGAWEWWGPGPAKVLVGLIFMFNAIGLGSAAKRKAK